MAGGPVQAIITLPPHADYAAELARHPLVAGLRLNTVMPIAEPRKSVLERLGALGPPLWLDLKTRQLRVVGSAVPPYTELRVSHRIRVRTPCEAWFGDGRERTRVLAVDGDRLILEDGPRRVVGPGESVNIPDPSLEIEGYLTTGDEQWLEAMRELGLKRAMLSYVERPEDVTAVRERLPDGELMLKIETRRGLGFAREHGASLGRLLAARGDLYVELPRPQQILGALRELIAADPQAVVASRLLPSLAWGETPACEDLGDVAWLYGLGYRSFLLGDELCLRRDSLLAALNLLEAIAGELAREPRA